MPSLPSLRYTLSFFLTLSLPLTSFGADTCVPVARWVTPGNERATPLDSPDLMTRLAQRRVVLLGEVHDSFEHHRWQLQTLAALYARRPDMVLGFEMFPRRAQDVLDRWVEGKLSEAEFLKQSEWHKVWNYDPSLYMPLFHFARMNRIPMLALNVDRGLTTKVRELGWDAVPESGRQGVSKPAPAQPAYLEELLGVYQKHRRPDTGHGDTPRDAKPVALDDPDFLRFVQGQQVWDRAMAEAIAQAVKKTDSALVIGIMGAGHVMHRYGVPYQLEDLGVADSAVLLAWDQERDCKDLKPGIADAVFGIAAPAETIKTGKPRLGIILDGAEGKVRVSKVMEGGVGDDAGIIAGDVLIEMAGVKIKAATDVSAIVQSQAPGTWLPITLSREGHEFDIVAKFPASP
ncbi:MAG: ChaN family lipoprotein [Gammaproteobacteria bacterium]|nr:ChaN family lipoprotein [Gammaproteobacteria bacterium]